MRPRSRRRHLIPLFVLSAATLSCTVRTQEVATGGSALTPVTVEGQPLAANIEGLDQALDSLGAPLPADLRAALKRAGQARDGKRLQELLDPRVTLSVHINPESRVKAMRGPAIAGLQQAGYTPVLLKVVNEAGVTSRLRIGSPQSGPVYAGMSELSGNRMQQQHLRENENVDRRTDRFLELEMFTAAPMTPALSGLQVEYAIALIYSTEAGRREATISFDHQKQFFSASADKRSEPLSVMKYDIEVSGFGSEALGHLCLLNLKDFAVNGKPAGDEVSLAGAGKVTVKAAVASSAETPLEPAYGGAAPIGGSRYVGDTVIKREVQAPDPRYQRRQRLVEVAVNGQVKSVARSSCRWKRAYD